MLRNDGRAAVIVPEGVLFGSSNAHKAVRKMLVDKRTPIEANDLPDVLARWRSLRPPVDLAPRSLSERSESKRPDPHPLVERGSEATESKRPDPSNDSEHSRPRTAQSFLVPKQEIVDNSYDLSLNRRTPRRAVPDPVPTASAG